MLNGKFQVYSKNSAQALTQLLAHFLVSGLAEQREHVLLIALNTRLVERVHAEEIAGDGAGLLEEVEQGADRCRGDLGDFDTQAYSKK